MRYEKYNLLRCPKVENVLNIKGRLHFKVWQFRSFKTFLGILLPTRGKNQPSRFY